MSPLPPLPPYTNYRTGNVVRESAADIFAPYAPLGGNAVVLWYQLQRVLADALPPGVLATRAPVLGMSQREGGEGEGEGHVRLELGPTRCAMLWCDVMWCGVLRLHHDCLHMW